MDTAPSVNNSALDNQGPYQQHTRQEHIQSRLNNVLEELRYF